jgi:hypothetical protein
LKSRRLFGGDVGFALWYAAPPHASCRPARVRSRTISRSNSAKAPSICTSARPAGPDVARSGTDPKGSHGPRELPVIDHRFARLRVVVMQSAIRCDQVLAAIGDQMYVERRQRIYAVGADLHTEGIDVTHPLAAQLGLHGEEKIIQGIPGIGEDSPVEESRFELLVPLWEGSSPSG